LAQVKHTLAVVLALALSGKGSRAEPSKIDARVFAGVPEGGRTSFLVVLRERADLSPASAIRDPAQRRLFVFDALRDVAFRTQAPLLEELRAEGVRARPHYLVNMIEVEGTPEVAAKLAARSEVEKIAANRPAALQRPAPIPGRETLALPASALGTLGIGANLERIGAPAVWSLGFTGQGIVIGDADTGLAWEHPAIKPHYRGWNGATADHSYNWHDAVHDAVSTNPCGSSSPTPCDDDGHGTSTAGLAVGDDGAGNQIGVAPGARLIACRNMDQGNGTPARYTECFEFFLAPTDSVGSAPRPDLGANVINNSWSCPASEGCTDPNVLQGVVENVRAAGILVVVAAGNAGDACDTVLDAPAIYEASFSIGATDDVDVVAPFSSRGPVTQDGSNRLKPDLVAPGVFVLTAVPPNGYTASFSGTSASAPHVAGAAALLWSAAPALLGDVDGTESVLLSSATRLVSSQDCPPFPGSEVPNAVFGYGRLDVPAAVALAAGPFDRFLAPLPRRHDATRLVPPRTP